MNPYHEPAYRTARAQLARGETVCVHCGGVASSPDHVPPLVEHRHTKVGDCCTLVPSCARCNLRRGAAAGNRARRRASRRRLAPGSGVIR